MCASFHVFVISSYIITVTVSASSWRCVYGSRRSHLPWFTFAQIKWSIFVSIHSQGEDGRPGTPGYPGYRGPKVLSLSFVFFPTLKRSRLFWVVFCWDQSLLPKLVLARLSLTKPKQSESFSLWIPCGEAVWSSCFWSKGRGSSRVVSSHCLLIQETFFLSMTVVSMQDLVGWIGAIYRFTNIKSVGLYGI